MPIAKYFGGKGEKVMRQLVRAHGAKKAKQIFGNYIVNSLARNK